MGVRVLGVLAGEDMSASLLERWARTADVVFAADSGADLLTAIGVVPHVVVGDLDSLPSSSDAMRWIREGRTRLSQDTGEDSTDCDKLLAEALLEGHDAVTLAAAEGDRLDHVLSTLHSAARSPLRVRVALRSGVGWVLNAGDEVEVATRPGRLVSLLPLSETEGASLCGVKWPLEGAALSALGMSSISNEAAAGIVSARIAEGSAFFFVELPEDEAPLW